MTKRRNFSAEFKARVALEALSGAHTMAELAFQAQSPPEHDRPVEAQGSGEPA